MPTREIPFGTSGDDFDLDPIGGHQQTRWAAAITSASTIRQIDGPATVQLSVTDPDYQLVHDRVLTDPPQVRVGGAPFQLVRVRVDQAGELSCTFEGLDSLGLKRDKGLLVAREGTRYRYQFARRLMDRADGVQATLIEARREPARVQLARGSEDDPDESSWKALKRLADEVGWRFYSLGRIPVFASDDWLAEGRTIHPDGRQPWRIARDSDVVLDASFTVDVGQPVDEMTVELVAGTYQLAPGHPVETVGYGPADGQWLVERVDDDLYQPHAKVDLTRRRQPDSEPDADDTPAVPA